MGFDWKLCLGYIAVFELLIVLQEPERFEQADREADEWREKEMAKDMANKKVISDEAIKWFPRVGIWTGSVCFQVDEMKAIEKVKAKRERRRLEPEVRLIMLS